MCVCQYSVCLCVITMCVCVITLCVITLLILPCVSSPECVTVITRCVYICDFVGRWVENKAGTMLAHGPGVLHHDMTEKERQRVFVCLSEKAKERKR